jgi:predicted ATPase/transcriptional regulator with XRE-family HTH domain
MLGNTASPDPALPFTTFGAFLRYLRRRARLTQRELGIAVGYSTPQISLLENAHRLPDLATVAALFVPALDVQHEPQLVNRLLELAVIAQHAGSHAEPDSGRRAASTRHAPRLPSRLPAPALPLIGRASEVAYLTDRLRDPSVRLLTLLGPPGVGKTRLALELAWDVEALFADGARFVALSAVADPALVVATIAQALGIRETSGDPDAAIALLGDELRDKQMLLVLDNFEHVLAAATLVGQLLAAAPRLKILTTSRRALHIYGEHEVPVAPLALPPITDETHAKGIRRKEDKQQINLSVSQSPGLPVSSVVGGQWSAVDQYAAVQLFIARAQAVRPDFALTGANALAVAAICVHLDGLPLAIELAAAQSKQFTPHELAAQLVCDTADDCESTLRLSVLKRHEVDLPARHRTLRGAIAWSYQLLTPGQQLLFERLGVFAGGFTLAAAEAICSDWPAQLADQQPALLESLGALVDMNLIEREGCAGEPRYRMLEMLRAFAIERLELRGDLAQIRRLHAMFLLELAQAADAQLAAPEQAIWFQRLENEQGNLRGALDWALESAGAELGLRLCVALWKFWRYRCCVPEGYRWTTRALSAAPAHLRQTQPELLARAAWGAGMLASVMRQDGAATAYLEQSLALWRLAEDDQGVASALTALGARAMRAGASAQALALQREALALYQSHGQLHGMTYAHNALGESLRSIGDYDASRAHYQASLAISRQIGHRRGVAVALANLAHLALAKEDGAAARQGFAESMAIFREIDDRINIATCLMGLACAVVKSVPARSGEAALVLGFAQQLLHEAGGQIETVDQQTFAPYIAACQHAIGEPGFAAICRRGRALSLESAVGQALAWHSEVL